MSKVLPTPAKRILPSKEATLFKELLTLYETRQLKKGQKTADQILKKFPEHGETLCMKGLVLTHMGKREEGIELVKKGVRLDLTSHICWHVFGLIQKGEKNYEEALKSYTQALRFDKENLNILRDAAQLQTQLRLYEALVDTRHTLLKLRPTLRQHWIGLAVAYHLNGNLVEAKKTLEHYERTLKNIPAYDVEHSETLLYHIHVLEEMGESSDALALLDVNAKSRAIVDRTAIMEIRARLLTKLGSEEAEHAWRVLIEHNPDCYDYFRGYLSNQGLSLDTPSTDALTILRDFSTQLPKAAAPRRLALSIASRDDFRELVKPYLLSGLTKGVPSLFVDIKSLYKDDSKRQIVEEIVEAARTDFSPDSSAPSSSSASVEPTTYLWTLYFLAQHYSYLSRPALAISAIELALAHTPTLPELHTCKARTLKRAGDLYGAARCADESRLLDGQDRFLNTKCAKYLLRAGLVEEASSILGLFTKKDAASPGADLEDMQSLLYLLEEADAHYRNGKLNLALKKYLAVQKIFNEIEDDQYDFHGYNLRKFTINIYLKLIKWEDRLRSHPAYIKAALSASQIYIAVHDDPSITSAASSSTAPLTDAEKKAKKKAKKAAQKVHEDAKKAPAPAAHEDKGLEAGVPKDDDPEGIKLLSVADPLEQAYKLLAPLGTLATENIDVWIAIYDVAIRRKKLLQAVKALNHARSLDAENPELHIRLVHFRQAASALPQQPPAPIGSVFTEALSKLLPEEVSLDTYNSQYLQRHSSSPRAVLAAAKVAHALQAPLPDVEATVFSTFGPDIKLDIPTALLFVLFLTTLKSSRLEEFRANCDARFELSTLFKPLTELEVLKKRALVANDPQPKADE
ncbi:N-alpha-acetyltransferase 16, NatA auxiliary subunit [Hypsizygus marmoreus]|uniref:N-alpha-acetyltransferase 16, NatA auxiliary subunit n=1 Tax=Hypsizygus marmoreus TaxID=39966 RepID=A0A369JYP8_HYPMA|nr:N-alpha-acetyltransferase 16, NatA auxiliary subunit [Hypsizygus marmoreus]